MTEYRASVLVTRMPRGRRSSLLDRWIQDQQCQHSTNVDIPSKDLDNLDYDPLPAPGSLCHPYLAYPHLSRASLPLDPPDEAGTPPRYYLPQSDDASSESCIQGTFLSPSVTSSPPRSRPQSKFIRQPSSLRTFHIPFRSSTPSISISQDVPPQTTSRPSLFQRLSRSGANPVNRMHARSTSLNVRESTDFAAGGNQGSSSPWKWRPSVLGHFSSHFSESAESSAPQTDGNPPPTVDLPRQSTSSCASEEENALQRSLTTSVVSHESTRSKFFKSGAGSSSSPSLWSQPTTFSVLSNDPAQLTHKASTIRMPVASNKSCIQIDGDSDSEDCNPPALPHNFDPTVPYLAYGVEETKRLSLSYLGKAIRDRRKKWLVISGIQIHESKRFEAAKQWCESFGEVSQIVRIPNGKLLVNFANARVAEDVCRLRTSVCIAGVGSVVLDWHTGYKYRTQ